MVAICRVTSISQSHQIRRDLSTVSGFPTALFSDEKK